MNQSAIWTERQKVDMGTDSSDVYRELIGKLPKGRDAGVSILPIRKIWYGGIR